MEQDHRRQHLTRSALRASAELQLRALADDVLDLRRRGEHDRADRLTQRRDALARDAYRRVVK